MLSRGKVDLGYEVSEGTSPQQMFPRVLVAISVPVSPNISDYWTLPEKKLYHMTFIRMKTEMKQRRCTNRIL